MHVLLIIYSDNRPTNKFRKRRFRFACLLTLRARSPQSAKLPASRFELSGVIKLNEVVMVMEK